MEKKAAEIFVFTFLLAIITVIASKKIHPNHLVKACNRLFSRTYLDNYRTRKVPLKFRVRAFFRTLLHSYETAVMVAKGLAIWSMQQAEIGLFQRRWGRN